MGVGLQSANCRSTSTDVKPQSQLPDCGLSRAAEQDPVSRTPESASRRCLRPSCQLAAVQSALAIAVRLHADTHATVTMVRLHFHMGKCGPA